MKLTNVLVGDWRQFHQWWSIRLAALVAVMPEIYGQLPIIQQYVPPNTYNHIMAGMGLAIILGRVLKQGPTPVAPAEGK